MKTYNIPEFLTYLNIKGGKSNSVAIIKYDENQKMRLKSDLVSIDFYMLAIKAGIEGEIDYGQTDFDESSSFLYMDQPKSELQSNVAKPFSGYNFLIDSRLFNKYALGTNFPNYDNHEALFLTTDEEILLKDIFGIQPR